MSSSAQIFQSSNKYRWKSFKWLGRLLLFMLLIFGLVFFIAVHVISKQNPNIPLEGRAVKKVLSGDIPAYRQSKLAKKYRGFRSMINVKWAAGRGCGQADTVLDLSKSNDFSDSLGIRAAFFVNWDAQSYFSLKKNITKLNLVLPEWLFIDPKADTLFSVMEPRVLELIKASGIKVMPMLSNNYNGVFTGKALHRILNDPAKSDKLVQDVARFLVKNNLAGINVDFEELHEKNNEVLSNFEKKLYTTLHDLNLLVTQNVSPFNDDYDYAQLAKYNDYIFLMAYDEYNDATKPGPICSQKWIESAVDDLAKKVDPSKIVLNLAAFGYDWTKKGKATPVTYQEALAIARESDAKIDYDNDTYNLNYSYYDDKNLLHEVYFTDAATNFNSLRFATEYGLAGTALWRLGSEDSRVWEFYNKPMNKAALQNFNFKALTDVPSMATPDFIGTGEILDMVSTPTDGHITPEIDSSALLISEETYDKLPSTYVVRKYGQTSEKKLVLTYDDGPDAKYTPEILDTLAYYHVPAAFFMIGINMENNIPLVKRVFREGHEIGNHTFTHPNIAEVSKKRAYLEMDATRLLLECITGHSTILFRAPFNADSDPEKYEEMAPVALSRTRNYITVGESIDPEDWQQGEIPHFTADTIFNRVVNIYNQHLANGDSSNIILLHDAGGDRSATVKATGMIIRYFESKGYTFTTIADLLHKSKADLMPPVPKGSGYRLIQLNYFLAETGFVIGQIVYVLFLTFLILGALRLFILLVLTLLEKRKETRSIATITEYPKVSIIVPAFNEEVNAVSSLQNLLRCSYPNFDIVFVDDGSIDATYEKVKLAFQDNEKIKIFTKPNGGKASALNYGIANTQAAYVVCIDADTKLLPDAVEKLMQHFTNPTVGAVAGSVKVGNVVNLLTQWQSIEYITSQNFDRRAFSYVNAITVVPGAIGAFSKKAIEDAGGFTTDTLAEDCDLTIRILRAGYIIENESKAIALTEAPETLKEFSKQRFRWTFGVMQTFWKHKDALFNVQYKALGWIALPDILVFKYIVPFFSPLGDLFMLLGLLSENRGKIAGYYLIFLLVDALIAAMAFAFEKEKFYKLFWIIPQRLVYRWIMLAILFRAFKRALKGELQNWGVLKRTGNVKDINLADAR
jgi:cellulose synthase/poly-beta-1,6-N-acetylglucosamine synthase-like glycosyltransferase/spore germination protein YaaH/peptidoglycan/xylan/chitin deacetylase (PgdA/CDA1 family)